MERHEGSRVSLRVTQWVTLLEKFPSVGKQQAWRNDLLSSHFGTTVCDCLRCVKVWRMLVRERYKCVSWVPTTERDGLFLLVDVTMQGSLYWKMFEAKLNHMTLLCTSRLSILRQRQTPLLQWLWCRAAVLWHQSTGHRRQRSEEGIHFIKPNMLDGWRWQPPWSTTCPLLTLNVLWERLDDCFCSTCSGKQRSRTSVPAHGSC